MVVKVVNCILCNGAIPGVKDETFLNHMQQQHRSYYNFDFIFASFFLTTDQMSLIRDCMNKIANNKDVAEEVRTKLLMETEKSNQTEATEEEENDTIFQEIEDSLASSVGTEVTITQLNHAKLEPIVKLEEKVDKTSNATENLETEIKKLRKQLKKDKFDCDKCDKVFKTEAVQANHIKKKHKSPKIPDSTICSDCGKQFKSKYDVASHRRLVHDDEIHICDLCSKEIKGFVMLKIHKRRFHKELEECNFCGKMVKKLKRHVMTMHTENDEKKFKCIQCGKGFIDKYRLQEHIKLHSRVKPKLEGTRECNA